MSLQRALDRAVPSPEDGVCRAAGIMDGQTRFLAFRGRDRREWTVSIDSGDHGAAAPPCVRWYPVIQRA